MKKPVWIAGPCAAESESQVMTTAEQLCREAERCGQALDYFRAGTWKPRSNPRSFSGVGEEALRWLSLVQQQLKVPVCTEVMSAAQVEKCAQHGIKTLWIGARTAVNPIEVQQLADAVRGGDFTVMVKNPLVPDLKLWIGNIERFLHAGVREVMAIHRGFPDNNENVYRNAPYWEIPINLKVLFPEMRILCDPSHLCGSTKWIAQVSQIALDYGFNGLMVESHCQPEEALSDAKQQLTPMEWGELVSSLQIRTELPNHDLICQRALLENVDHQLSDLLAKRMHIVDEIAEIKKRNHLSVVQPQQWQQVVERYWNDSQDPKYQEFIQQFLEILHQASIKRQK